MDLSMSELLTYLIGERSFYARIANALKRVAAPGHGTMAVGIHDGRLTLYYDPAFLKACSMRTLMYVLDHEMYHLAMDHIPRYLELLAQFQDPMQRAKATAVFNIAMDCAVNTNLRNSPHFKVAQEETRQQLLTKLPPGAELDVHDGMVLPESYDLPLDSSFEFYQLELMERVRFRFMVGSGGKGDGEALMQRLLEDNESKIGNSHNKWDTTEGKGDKDNKEKRLPEELQSLAEKLRTQAKQILRKAVRDHKKDRGLLPGEVAEFLESYLADPIVPWWEILTARVQVTKRSKPSRGVQRPNRPLLAMAEEDFSIIPALGKLKDPRYRAFFVTDTSGSMDTKSLEIACSELTHLLAADEDMEVRWIQGDAAVHFDKLFVSGQTIPAEMHGRGGTDFDAYFEYMWKFVGNDEVAPDIVIVYTDGYAPGVQQRFWLPPEIPVLWLVTKGGAVHSLKTAGYGEIIICDPDQAEMYKHAA